MRSVFSEAGLNFDELTSVLVRASKGIPLTESDHDLIRASVGVLNSYLPNEAEGLGGQGAHDDGSVGRLKELKRRLELAQLT